MTTPDPIPAAIARLRAVIDHCDRALARAGPAAIVVYRFRGQHRGEPCCPWGRSGPAGMVINTDKQSTTVRFRASEVRAACEKQLRRLES